MNTETTEQIPTPCNGWVFYDADCAFCSGWVERTRGLLMRRGFHFVPLQASWVKARLALPESELLREMKLLAADGQILGGADAAIELARHVWWAWPIYVLAHFPGAKPVLRSIYRRIARNRHCLKHACSVPKQPGEPAHHRASSFYELP